jgi:hypothetical protein
VDSWSLAVDNLTSPPVLAFVLGALAVLVRSDLRLPDPIQTWISTYLLLAIGLKGGDALRGVDAGDIALPALATVGMGLVIPVVAFQAARAVLAMSADDAGSVAAHYGSVSVVTFTAAMVFAEDAGYATEGFMTSLVALLEIPGIIVALALAGSRGGGVRLGEALREVLAGRSVLLLVGGLVIGRVSSEESFARVEPFFVQMFTGLLALFLLDMGATVAGRLRESRGIPLRAAGFAVVAPCTFGAVGVLVGDAAGLSMGGAGVFGVMTASASYIAAPAAVRIALPRADMATSLGMALAVTFPFNLAVGIPVMFVLADAVA